MTGQTTTRLYIVRHGATQLSAEDRFAGAVDVELSKEGKFQAGRLAQRMADDSIASIVVLSHVQYKPRPFLPARIIFL